MNFNCRKRCIRLGAIIVLFIILFTGCGDKLKNDPDCEIAFAVKTEIFYQGCTLPISVQASDGINAAQQVRLWINEEDLGLVPTSPHKYYWNTSDLPPGDYRIKAIYQETDQSPPTDEKIIDLLPVLINCPEEVNDIDGNVYPVIQIGNQCWMQENLKVTHYPNGETLINGSDSIESIFASPFGVLPNSFTGWYFLYDHEAQNSETYGYLYDWATTMHGNTAANNSEVPIQGICPEGWHVPDVHEWRQLIDFTGGVDIAANKLKESGQDHWNSNILEVDNASGFTALPGGCFVPPTSFIELKESAYFWSATETIVNHAEHVILKSGNPKSFILGLEDSKRFGYSVRCVMD